MRYDLFRHALRGGSFFFLLVFKRVVQKNCVQTRSKTFLTACLWVSYQTAFACVGKTFLTASQRVLWSNRVSAHQFCVSCLHGKFSMGFKFGEKDGHERVWILFCFNQSLTSPEVCLGPSSCMKWYCSPNLKWSIDGKRFCSKMSW